ncbi:hypothetical protein EYF80_018180 [Liparis tanakae]|uniref:Uncharacterized protein n=1 Tax=Liparis tanakae TaxID=230148 RepID=A0A4Z2I2G0_9TELE|nr:hypothetical protein EYF80_018180 [Liparis tanakae]
MRMRGQKHADGRRQTGASDSRCEKNKKTFRILTGGEDLRVCGGAVRETARGNEATAERYTGRESDLLEYTMQHRRAGYQEAATPRGSRTTH